LATNSENVEKVEEISNKETSQVNTAGDQSVTQQEITTFSDDATHTVSVRAGSVVPYVPDNPYYTETIIQWLQRPYPILEFSWTSAQLPGARIHVVNFPFALMQVDAIWDKLKNFYFFRAGVRLGIRVNGTRFHYGKLMAMWSPQTLNLGTDYNRSDNIFSASGFPHTIISPTDCEVNELIMPFCVPFSYIDLRQLSLNSGSRIQNMGQFAFYVLNPLRSSAATIPSVRITLFAAFEDVQVAGYTTNDYTKPINQSSPAQVVVPPSVGVPNISDLPNPVLASQAKRTDWMPSSGAVSQTTSVSNSIIGAGREAIAKSSNHLISGIAEATAFISGLFVEVPYIGVAAEGISLLSSGVAAVAGALGYCLPLSQQSIYRTKLLLGNFANTHGLDNAVSLSVLPDNKVAPCHNFLGGVPGEQDLMSIATTPCLLQTFTWGSGSGPGAILFQAAVDPLFCAYDAPNVFPTLLHMAAAPFRYWRGSLRYCLQVTCSAFHSGRLRISWTPDKMTTTSIILQSNAISYILDTQTETDYYFTIPYLAALPYLPTSRLNTATRFSNGVLSVSIVNNLVFPESPIPDVFVNLWVSAGPDFQVGCPYLFNMSDIAPSLVAEGMTRDQMKAMPYPPLIPGSGSRESNILMGETIATIKDVYKRDSYLSAVPELTEYNLRPFGAHTVNDWDGAPAGRVGPTYLQWFKNIFRYARGSFVYKFVATRDAGIDPAANETTMISYVYNPLATTIGSAITSTTTFSTAATFVGQGLHITNNSALQLHEVAIPFYADQYAYINSHDSDILVFNSVPSLVANIPNDAIIYYHPGDDFELIFMVGPNAYSYYVS
jgi:hypothetical protein